MGPLFLTHMAILIPNIDNSRLLCDGDYRIPPPF